MISVKIYCMKTHREYENVYMVIDDVLKRSRLEYRIERVTERRNCTGAAYCFSRISLSTTALFLPAVVRCGRKQRKS